MLLTYLKASICLFSFATLYLEKKGEKNHNENGGRSGHIFIFLAREFIRSKKGHRRAYQRPRNGTPASKSHSQVHKKWRRVKSDDHQPRSRGKYTELIYKLSFNIEKWRLWWSVPSSRTYPIELSLLGGLFEDGGFRWKQQELNR